MHTFYPLPFLTTTEISWREKEKSVFHLEWETTAKKAALEEDLGIVMGRLNRS